VAYYGKMNENGEYPVAVRASRTSVPQALLRRIAVLIGLCGLIVLCPLVFAACGGDDNKNDGGDGKTPAASAASGGGDIGELQKVAAKFKDATFHAVYAPSGSTTDVPLGGVPSSIRISELTLVKSGQDKLRFDMRGARGGEVFYLALIQNGTESYQCFPGAPATATVGSGAGVCVNTSAHPTNPLGELSKTFVNFGIGNIEIQDKSKREIAGEDATCYAVLDKDANEVNTTCFSDDGVLLANASFEATSVERDVTEEDFNLPYPLADGPGLGP
jgi:hypothetical protein